MEERNYRNTRPKYEYEAKIFKNGWDYGIANGVISKLTIWNQKNEEVCVYDRGWVLEPDTFKDLMAYREVLKIFTSTANEMEE